MDLRNYAGGGGRIKTLEEDIISLLSPIEPLVMRVQSLLVWEYPRRSAVMFICVHLLFWFLAVTSMSAYFLISTLSVIIFFVDTWKKKIWPEIRVPPPVPDDVDEWTPVHPRLLNVLEISHHAAVVLNNVFDTLQEWRLYRRHSPRIFSMLFIIICLLLLAVGHFIPGIMLSYILVMSVLLWPCVVYHNFMKKVYLKMEPAFMWLDYNLKIKMTRSPRATSTVAFPSTSTTATVEDDFDEFCPTADPTTTALLAKAITDSEDEGGSSAVPTPQLSKQPSVEESDNEEEDFEAGLERMPSFDDLDQTDDEFAPTDDGTRGAMPFIATHFGENSDSENEEINFPDISELDATLLDRTPTGEQTAFSALASSVVSKTLSSMVEHALYGARDDKSPTSAYGRLPGTDAQLTYTRTDKGEAVDLVQQDLSLAEEDEEEDEEEENLAVIEGELEKEFDFLDDFDPGSKTKK